MGLENPVHILIILAVVLMLFGAKRLPEMGKGLGSGIRGFKEGLTSSEPPAAMGAAPSEPIGQAAATAPVSDTASSERQTVA